MGPIILGATLAGLALLSSRRNPPGAHQPPAAAAIYRLPRYVPRTADAVMLFQSAAKYAGLPAAWAHAPELHAIIARESEGYVGRPNYQFGELFEVSSQARWPEVWRSIQAGTWRTMLATKYKNGPRAKQSSATGLGQLTVSNVPSYYPSGVAGIGVALEEAIGMLRYIADRYGTPAAAWARYGQGQEGY